MEACFGILKSLFFSFILLLLVKEVAVYFIYKNNNAILNCIYYFFSDFPVLIVFLFIVITNLFVKNIYFTIICIILFSIVLLFFFVDIICIYFFQSRALVPEIFRFVAKSQINNSTIGALVICIGFILLIFFVSFATTKYLINLGKNEYIILLLVSILSYVLVGLIDRIRNSGLLFQGNIFTLLPIFRSSNGSDYGCIDGMGVPDIENYFGEEGGSGKNVNIIMIFAESLSAIDSKNMNGDNNMPGFDMIQNNGIRFTNFFSNGIASYQAHISAFLGLLPWTLHNYKGYKYITPTLPEFLNSYGYNTIFCSTVSLDNLDERGFLNSIGFKKIIGQEVFYDNKKYTRGAAPDGDLYKKVLDEVDNQDGNYFIGLQTISFHPPYNSPYGETQELALKYADDQLLKFYKALEKKKFFNNGLLIVFGDHRMMRPIKKNEYKIYGDSWYARPVATIVGSGVIPGTINNNIIQHTDFFYSIKQLISKDKIRVDKMYNNIFRKISNRKFGIVLNPSSGVGGKKIGILYDNGKNIFLSRIHRKDLVEKSIQYLASSLKYQIGEKTGKINF